MPIGVLEEFAFEREPGAAAPGDRLLLYTDGALEAVDADDAIYGAERLQRMLAEQRPREPDTALVNIIADLRLWSGDAGLEDDITLLSVDATGGDAS